MAIKIPFTLCVLQGGFDSVLEGQVVPDKNELSEEDQEGVHAFLVASSLQTSHFHPFLSVTEFQVKDSRSSISGNKSKEKHISI